MMMPKLPPPRTPRTDQFSFSLAVTSSPSAVTRSTESTLSTAAPYLRINQPIPPPRVSPETPVWLTIPPTVASPKSRVRGRFAPQHARPGARRPGLWVDVNAFHRRHVDHEAAVAQRVTADPVATFELDSHEQDRAPGEADWRRRRRRRRCSGRSRLGAGRSRRSRSCGPRRSLRLRTDHRAFDGVA